MLHVVYTGYCFWLFLLIAWHSSKTVCRVSFSFLPKGAKWDCMDYWGGKYVFVCKACGKLGGSGGTLPWEILILNLLLGAIWWNLELFTHKHNLPFIVSLSFYNWFTCKTEFSAYPTPPPSPRKKPCSDIFHGPQLVIFMLVKKSQPISHFYNWQLSRLHHCASPLESDGDA